MPTRDTYNRPDQQFGSMLNFNTYTPVHVGRPIEELEGMMKSLSETNKAIASQVDAVDLMLDNKILAPEDEHIRQRVKENVKSGIASILESNDYSFIEGKVNRIAKDVVTDPALKAAEVGYAQYLEKQKILDQGIATGAINYEIGIDKKRRGFKGTKPDQFGNYSMLYEDDPIRPNLDFNAELTKLANTIKPEFFKGKGIHVEKTTDGIIKFIQYNKGQREELSEERVRGILEDYVNSESQLGSFLDDYYKSFHRNREYEKSGVAVDPTIDQIKSYKKKMLEPFIQSVIYNKDLSINSPGILNEVAMMEYKNKLIAEETAREVQTKQKVEKSRYALRGDGRPMELSLGLVVDKNNLAAGKQIEIKNPNLRDPLKTDKVIISGFFPFVPTINRKQTRLVLPESAIGGDNLVISFDLNVVDKKDIPRDQYDKINAISKGKFDTDINDIFSGKAYKSLFEELNKKHKGYKFNIDPNTGKLNVISIAGSDTHIGFGEHSRLANINIQDILDPIDLDRLDSIATENNKKLANTINIFNNLQDLLVNSEAKMFSPTDTDRTKNEVDNMTKVLFSDDDTGSASLKTSGSPILDLQTGLMLNSDEFNLVMKAGIVDKKGNPIKAGKNPLKVRVIGDYDGNNNFTAYTGNDLFSKGYVVELSNGRKYAVGTDGANTDDYTYQIESTRNSIFSSHDTPSTRVKFRKEYLSNTSIKQEETGNADERLYTIEFDKLGEEKKDEEKKDGDKQSGGKDIDRMAYILSSIVAGNTTTSKEEFLLKKEQLSNNLDALQSGLNDISIMMDGRKINLGSAIDLVNKRLKFYGVTDELLAFFAKIEEVSYNANKNNR